jgi:hypothetical protein
MEHYTNMSSPMIQFTAKVLQSRRRCTSICTLAVLNIVPPEQKHGGSIADDPINLAHLLGMLHIVDLIC